MNFISQCSLKSKMNATRARGPQKKQFYNVGLTVLSVVE